MYSISFCNHDIYSKQSAVRVSYICRTYSERWEIEINTEVILTLLKSHNTNSSI